MNVTIYRLCDRPEWANTCRSWDLAVWPRTPGNEAFFAEHYTGAAANQKTLCPHVWVAAVDDMPIGMISMVTDDHPDFIELSPWLASAYVVPTMRRKGVFRKLHDTLIDFVHHEKLLKLLYVYTHLDFTLFG